MGNMNIVKNENFGTFEISFAGVPAAEIREFLKASGYRWHGVKKVWYGKNDITEQLTSGAAEVKNAEKTQKTDKKAARPSLWERCKTDDIPGYATDNNMKKAATEEARKKGWAYDRAVAVAIRSHLKKCFPEVSFSVTSGGAGYLNKVDIRIKSSPYGRGEVVDEYGRKRTQNSPELQAVLTYCEKLHAAYDADDGDYYADYGAHHDLYGVAGCDWDYIQTEQTPEILADMADFAEHNKGRSRSLTR